MENNSKVENLEYGQVRISDEVVGIIAGIAAQEVEGVTSMSGGFTGNITEIFGKKSHSKGVKVEVGEQETTVDLHVIVDYGVKIPEVAWKIQEKVKNAIETMTGLKVVEVNIHVEGVNINKKIKEKEQKEQSETEKTDIE